MSLKNLKLLYQKRLEFSIKKRYKSLNMLQAKKDHIKDAEEPPKPKYSGVLKRRGNDSPIIEK